MKYIVLILLVFLALPGCQALYGSDRQVDQILAADGAQDKIVVGIASSYKGLLNALLAKVDVSNPAGKARAANYQKALDLLRDDSQKYVDLNRAKITAIISMKGIGADERETMILDLIRVTDSLRGGK